MFPRALLLSLAVGLAGCFSEPVATGERLPIDETLVGEWACVSAESAEDRARLSVYRFDDHQYYVEWSERAGKVDRYRAYAARLRGAVVFNVEDLGETARPRRAVAERAWTAVRAAREGKGTLAIQAPAKKILDLSDEKAGLRELRATADAASAWQPFARCTPAAR